jgi:hypothetical protein
LSKRVCLMFRPLISRNLRRCTCNSGRRS